MPRLPGLPRCTRLACPSLLLATLLMTTARTSSGHSFAGMVRFSSLALPGVVSLTTLFGDLALQLDASEHPDPMGRVPRLDIVPLRLEPA